MLAETSGPTYKKKDIIFLIVQNTIIILYHVIERKTSNFKILFLIILLFIYLFIFNFFFNVAFSPPVPNVLSFLSDSLLLRCQYFFRSWFQLLLES